MGATVRNPGGGVLGFAIAFLAVAFGSALGLPGSVRLLVIGAGVLLAVLSAGMRGFGLAALVLGGIVLLSSITLLGALGVGRVLKAPPSHPTPPTTPPPQEGGGYSLTLTTRNSPKPGGAWHPRPSIGPSVPASMTVLPMPR
jgi:hypothetical protein